MRDYKKVLDEAWTDATAPRGADAPTVVSLFAGCGGSSLGYRMAGFKVRLAVEWDEHAAQTYAANNPGTPLHVGDIGKLSTEDALRLADLQPGELDILDGSPPCQGFSTAGQRMVDDPRNQLFREYIRLLEAFRPRVLVMENVSGMVKGKMKLTFVEILGELKARGYAVAVRLMDTRWFGVPQARQRVIFVGVRNDIALDPVHPVPFQARPWTCREASVGVAHEEMPRLSDCYGKMWSRIPPGKNASHLVGKGFNAQKVHPDKPCNTIPKIGTNQSGIPTGFGTMMHWAHPRGISIPEAKRFQSFPDQFILEGTHEQRWARIGNSVPPLFMRAVASAIRDGILRPLKQEARA